MLALVVTIDIMPGRREAFLEAMLDDARGSLQNEPGCLRFDVVQDSENPNRIYLYEVYRDKAALEGHRRYYLAPLPASGSFRILMAKWTPEST